jgi:hypothetical protein
MIIFIIIIIIIINMDFFFIHQKKMGKKLGIIFGVFLVWHHEHS